MSLSLLFLVLLLRLISNLLISLDRSLKQQMISLLFNNNKKLKSVYAFISVSISNVQMMINERGKLKLFLTLTHSKMNSSVKTGFCPSLGCVFATWTLFK